MKDKKNRFAFLWNIFLFSALGCFSLFFLVHYTDIPVHHQEKLMTAEVFASAIILFNGIGLSLKYIDNWLIRTYPSFIRDRKLLILFFIVSAFFLLVTNYFLMVTIKWLTGSAHPFIVAAKGMRLLSIVFLVELFIIGQMMVSQFYKNIVEMYRRTKDLEESAIKTRYMALQSQLNPHFLFNSLNTLVAEIEYAPQKAVEFTRNLSDIYRYILSCQNKSLVSIGEELDFIRKFIFLHQVRLGDCLELENELPLDVYECSIPPLTLQLLVENVVKHNVISPAKPMVISIYADRIDDADWLVVSNEIHPKKGVASTGKGLDNLLQRNLLVCQKEIIVENKDNRFIIKVPIVNEYE